MNYKVKVQSVEAGDNGLVCVIELSTAEGRHVKEIFIDAEGMRLRGYHQQERTIKQTDWEKIISVLNEGMRVSEKS